MEKFKEEKMEIKDFIKEIQQIEETYQNHNDFYELAERYGFCTPWNKSSENRIVLSEIE